MGLCLSLTLPTCENRGPSFGNTQHVHQRVMAAQAGLCLPAGAPLVHLLAFWRYNVKASSPMLTVSARLYPLCRSW